MLTLVAFVFVLGVLIFVHELGHYLMARRLGVRILTFSLGFGPRLIGFVRGGTDYCVRAIPLGGYVKMAGENPDEPREGQDDEFLSKTKWQRFQILIMGPAMNIVLSVVLLWVVLLRGAEVPAFEDRAPVVGAVTAASPAAKAGIGPGDRIVRVNGRSVDTWENFFLVIGTRANRETPITFLRQGREQTVTLTPTSTSKYEVGDIGVVPDTHPHVAQVNPGEPAAKSGVQPGDVVLAVNGEPINFARQLTGAISKHPEEPITLAVMRQGARRDLQVTPERRGKIGWIGISIGDEIKVIKPGPLGAAKMSLQRNIEFGGLIFRTVWGLITQETSPRQLMGPVAIAQLSGESAAAGWFSLFMLMASISLNLGILNLLPIPVLDGGHIFIMALEGIARHDFSVRVKEKMLLAGFVVLMALMVTVIYNDLTRIQWISKLMFWR